MPSQDKVSLRSGNLTLEAHPRIGCAITSLRFATSGGAVDLLRPTPTEAIAVGNPTEASCYPLIPFSNRIKDGRFSFGGHDYQLQPNLPGHPHPLHGHGWRSAWEVVEQAADRAKLALHYNDNDFPSTYTAQRCFQLTANALKIDVEVRNTGNAAMPCGVGLHPFFPKPPDTILQANLSHVWLGTDDSIPVVRVDVPERWDFAAGRRLDGLQLDHCFGGWDKRARIEWPSRGLAMNIDAEGPVEHAVIYAPPDRDFFCFEPVSNANDAFNLSARGVEDVGVQILEPGQALAATFKLTVVAL